MATALAMAAGEIASYGRIEMPCGVYPISMRHRFPRTILYIESKEMSEEETGR